MSISVGRRAASGILALVTIITVGLYLATKKLPPPPVLPTPVGVAGASKPGVRSGSDSPFIPGIIADLIDVRGGSATSQVYHAKDGTALSVLVEEHASLAQSRAALADMAKRADRIVDTRSLPQPGRYNRDRIVIVASGDKGESEVIAAWTQGNELWSIHGPRLDVVLEFEQWSAKSRAEATVAFPGSS